MSHIDSFRHQIVGLFGPLPVYRPLEDIDGDFQCTTTQLLLGGGSGEHPAMSLTLPPAAVARYLQYCLNAGVLEADGAAPAQEAMRVAITPYVDQPNDELLIFYEWSMATHERFGQLCRSPALPKSYRIYEHTMSLHDWLILGFGEFIFFAMPDLASPLLTSLNIPHQRFRHVYFSNIMLIPPNMPVYANGGNAYRSFLIGRA